MPNPLRAVFAAPLFRRIGFHARRIGGQLDRHFFTALLTAVVGFVLIAALAVTLLEEEKRTLAGLGSSFYWAITTVIGSGDASFVTSPGGYIIGWLLAFFGVAIVAAMTGAVVGFVIDFLLKEGQGLGASGYKGHIIVCGWNTTARDLVDELRGDEYATKVVVLADVDKNPAGDGVYFVRGDSTNEDDLARAGIEHAAAALVFPRDASDEADMHSILTVLAIEHASPGVRTVAEVNNPRNEQHFRRADVDELLVTSKIASHLLARSALYPGLSGIVTDIVSGGEGSELYRVSLPEDYCGMTIDDLAAKLRRDHRATLLSVNRGGHSFVNPDTAFILQPGDDAVVVADSLGSLAPLEVADATVVPATAAVVPSA